MGSYCAAGKPFDKPGTLWASQGARFKLTGISPHNKMDEERGLE